MINKVTKSFWSLFLLLALYTQAGAGLERGLLWKIEGAAARPSYILGTMHSEDARIVNLAPAVKTVFKQADSFSAELNMQADNLLQASQQMFYTDETKLQSIIDRRLYQDSVQLLAEYGIPEMLVQKMKPWAAATTLSMPKSSSGLFLDLVLFMQAQAMGKKVYGLETIDEQLAVFENMPLKQQISMLRDAVREYDASQAMLAELLELYVQRDLEGIRVLSESYMQKGDVQVAAYFQKTVIDDRNRRMLQRMQPRLKEGHAFIAVGALHLSGEKGLLRLLEKQGLRVSPVY